MNEDKVPILLWVIISGTGLFIGVALLTTAALLDLQKKKTRLTKIIALLLAFIGVAVTYLSATPFSLPFYICFSVTFVLWILVTTFNILPNRNLHKIISLVLIALSTLAGILETSYFDYPSIPQSSYTKMYLIGDSISAGIGAEEEMTWPKIIRQQNSIELIDLSIAGATVGSALKKQLPHIESDNAIVLLEIGGNDSLQYTSIDDYERDLRSILQQVSTWEKLVIMLEVPVLPWHIRYARIQRKLAKEFDVILIPKRLLVSVFAKPGNTLDLAHLSEQGHQYMAEKIWKIIGSAFILETNTPK